MTEADRLAVGVRAAVHALDAALGEHRRALTLAAGRREAQRIPLRREVKAAAQAAALALEQPAERPMRGLRVAETWILVDRARHRLTPGVRAEHGDRELVVTGPGWTGRLILAPGEGPAAAAREAVGVVAAGAAAAPERGAARLALVTAAQRAHAGACLGAAAALAAADRDAAGRHADRARLDACIAELEDRLGARRLGEDAERSGARDRLRQARLHLQTPPEQPYEWLGAWPAALAGPILRDLPEETLDDAQPALVALAGALGGGEPVLALALAPDGEVLAVTPSRALAAAPGGARELPLGEAEPPDGLAEQAPGRLAAVLDLVTAVALLGAPQA
jgi:hypothetical protein